MYSNAKRCLSIDYQPNSKNLYNRIKENLYKYISIDGNYIKLRSNVSHEKFIHKLKKLNEEKREV
jgi:5,10-methylene-tetrahydrofolate dehydrogenase/methenyl tetrahydrofolate cyclohydrolase